jgi:hypothetical protein
MKQSDHKQRVTRAKEAAVEDRQMAALAGPESVSEDYDYLVLVILVASVALLALLASRRRRAGYHL